MEESGFCALNLYLAGTWFESREGTSVKRKFLLVPEAFSPRVKKSQWETDSILTGYGLDDQV